ncbi:MAG: hypothetical protein BWY47_00132 [Bacteroidetes bacterium ADurb.Bin302]|nr:MAG: hypothetical protein BWY47_00132 [Bacteroidetes bacterium ADurb.Bin302]
MPETDAVCVVELFAFEILKSCIILFLTEFVPLLQYIPLIKPAVDVLLFVVPLVRLAIKLFCILVDVI